MICLESGGKMLVFHYSHYYNTTKIKVVKVEASFSKVWYSGRNGKDDKNIFQYFFQCVDCNIENDN